MKKIIILLFLLLLASCNTKTAENEKKLILGIDSIDVNFFTTDGKQYFVTPGFEFFMLSSEIADEKLEITIEGTKIETFVEEISDSSSEKMSYISYMVTKDADWEKIYDLSLSNEMPNPKLSNEFAKNEKDYKKEKDFKIPKEYKLYKVTVIIKDYKNTQAPMKVKIGKEEKIIEKVNITFTNIAQFKEELVNGFYNQSVFSQRYGMIGLSYEVSENDTFTYTDGLRCQTGAIIKKIRPLNETQEVKFLAFNDKEQDPNNIKYTCTKDNEDLLMKIVIDNKADKEFERSLNSYDFIIEYAKNKNYEFVYATNAVRPYYGEINAFEEAYLHDKYKKEYKDYFFNYNSKMMIEYFKMSGEEQNEMIEPEPI